MWTLRQHELTPNDLFGVLALRDIEQDIEKTLISRLDKDKGPLRAFGNYKNTLTELGKIEVSIGMFADVIFNFLETPISKQLRNGS